ncbi:MAG: peptidoglycan DD-metalloendopeptidase family protein [Bacteroidales bacterium]|nr:peptidoglycan DD-metalloendopeptidase family protein [Bacteroidales bacterium]MDD3907272.1 peptidoglycan DD-metalloendopeptidase family protein [Bacteroidales bacterium]MDD4711861.1 peptidoglycan DD-metalloendopeptidase family protein [Bacteroidales bacterium]
MKRGLSILLICLLSVGFYAHSSRLSDLEKKRKEALERVERTTQMLSKNKVTTKNTIYRLNVLGDQIKARESFLNDLSKELGVISTEMSEIQQEYSELSLNLSVKKEQYAKSIRLMSRRNKSEDKLMFILSARDLNQMTSRMRYLDEYAGYQRVQANEISRKQTELSEKRLALETVYREKEAVKNKQAQEARILEKERGDQKNLVSQLKGKEKQLKAELSKQRKQAEQLNRQIENLIAEEARKAAAKAASDKTTVRKAETKGGYAMTIDEKRLSSDFGKNQGALPFPVSQQGTIIVHFGEQKYQDLKYVQNNSKGIDIQTRPGASAIAVFGGVVSKVFALPGFNNSVIIRHGNYLTVYANLSNIYVKAGDKVKIGEAIGKIFVDGEQNDLTVLHFQLWRDTQRLNPELWLRQH